MVRTLGYIYLKLLDVFIYNKLPAVTAEMRWTSIIHHSHDVYSGSSETERSRCFWM